MIGQSAGEQLRSMLRKPQTGLFLHHHSASYAEPQVAAMSAVGGKRTQGRVFRLAVMAGERFYLVCYDYGMGALWWWISATSGQEILATYRDVIVLDEPPTWWTEGIDKRTARLRIGEVAPGLEKVD